MKDLTTHTTRRKFAIAHNVLPTRLCGIMDCVGGIKHKFIHNRMQYFNIEELVAWFACYQREFTKDAEMKDAIEQDFWCNGAFHLVPASQKGASGKCCISCDAKVAKANKVKHMVHSGRGKVPAHILKFEKSKNDMAFKLNMAVINDINAWMYE